MEPVHAAHVVAEAIDLIRPLGNQRSITVDFRDGAICDCHVLSDRQRLIQVLLNLLSNAVKYNREGSTVVVSCHLDNGCLSVKVSGAGPGMTPYELERLFALFRRLGAEHSTEDGTGLRLVLSRHLAATMGGTLEVASRHGQGSQFTETPPVVDAPTTHPATSLALSIEPSFNGPRRTVLSIEDDVSNLTLVEQILSLRPDVEIHAAMQGRQGLDLARQHRPDLVLFEAAGYLTKPLAVPAFLSELGHHFGS